jgi:hypothetical protein
MSFDVGSFLNGSESFKPSNSSSSLNITRCIENKEERNASPFDVNRNLQSFLNELSSLPINCVSNRDIEALSSVRLNSQTVWCVYSKIKNLDSELGSDFVFRFFSCDGVLLSLCDELENANILDLYSILSVAKERLLENLPALWAVWRKGLSLLGEGPFITDSILLMALAESPGLATLEEQKVLFRECWQHADTIPDPLLNSLIDHMGDEFSNFVDHLFSKYPVSDKVRISDLFSLLIDHVDVSLGKKFLDECWQNRIVEPFVPALHLKNSLVYSSYVHSLWDKMVAQFARLYPIDSCDPKRELKMQCSNALMTSLDSSKFRFFSRVVGGLAFIFRSFNELSEDDWIEVVKKALACIDAKADMKLDDTVAYSIFSMRYREVDLIIKTLGDSVNNRHFITKIISFLLPFGSANSIHSLLHRCASFDLTFLESFLNTHITSQYIYYSLSRKIFGESNQLNVGGRYLLAEKDLKSPIIYSCSSLGKDGPFNFQETVEVLKILNRDNPSRFVNFDVTNIPGLLAAGDLAPLSGGTCTAQTVRFLRLFFDRIKAKIPFEQALAEASQTNFQSGPELRAIQTAYNTITIVNENNSDLRLEKVKALFSYELRDFKVVPFHGTVLINAEEIINNDLKLVDTTDFGNYHQLLLDTPGVYFGRYLKYPKHIEEDHSNKKEAYGHSVAYMSFNGHLYHFDPSIGVVDATVLNEFINTIVWQSLRWRLQEIRFYKIDN